ncbi:dephospho-CoA kinase [Psychromonas aquatilis]|uniref:Dephospho-CoA kinase n=1 Tax=Psychromonas aquatilis TaxID=2005072 RepID=A0ABU9GRE3_9GAMM
MSLIIGLTGGIGSGKSTVAKEFIELGIEVVDADLVAREVVAPGKPALTKIESDFGKTVITANGALNRAALRDIIFQSEAKKQWLNELLHPLIRESMLSQLASANSAYVILEAPLLIENKLTQYVDYTVVVDVLEEIQVKRAMQRDTNTREQIEAIMKAQINRENRLQHADFVIDNNNNDLVTLKLTVNKLHLHFLSLLS